MDVSCSRCGTEYEFDDALVSDRGTTVKCTHCGHQFKVHPARGGGGPERWVVRTTSGRELVYTSLRDLQRGISQRQIQPDDLLSRGGAPVRTLASIAELEPFFQRSSVPPPVVERAPEEVAGAQVSGHSGVDSPYTRAETSRAALPPPKPSGVGPTAPMSARELGVAPSGAEVSGPKPPIPGRRMDGAAPRPPAPADMLSSARAGVEQSPIQQPKIHEDNEAGRAASQSSQLGSTEEVEPLAAASELAAVPERAAASELAAVPEQVPSEPPEKKPLSARRSPSEARLTPPHDVRILEEPISTTPPPSEVREPVRVEESGDLRFTTAMPSSRGQRSRWIMGVVLLGALALVGLTVGRDYLKSTAAPAKQEQSADARVLVLVERGNKALSDGDFEGAKEQYDKASALAEKDTGLLVAQARLEAARADIVWLKLRLLDPNDEELAQVTHRELAGRVRKALSAAAEAEAVAPENANVIRARVDALRLQGELQKARAHVAAISTTESQPETAYVLAALDMAEKSQNWGVVAERLRTAISSETGPGRAHAALVYALARSGELSAAQVELDKITDAVRPHPLVNELREFVKRHVNASDAGPEAEVPTVDPSSFPAITEGPAQVGASLADARSGESGDFRVLLSQASSALKAGDEARAERLYRSVLSQQPGNTEAMAGLAHINAAKRDPKLAAEAYDEVLQKNPNYLPALLGKANQRWAAGDHAGAADLYQRVIDSAGSSTEYGQRAQARLAEYRKLKAEEKARASEGDAGASAPASPSASPQGGSGAPAEKAPAEKENNPYIDTTDLPGL